MLVLPSVLAYGFVLALLVKRFPFLVVLMAPPVNICSWILVFKSS